MHWNLLNNLTNVVKMLRERPASAAAAFLDMERAHITLNCIGDGVISTDHAARVSYLNPVAETMTGWSCVEAVGLPVEQVLRLINGDNRQPAPNPLALAMLQNQAVGLRANTVLIHRDGTEIAIEDTTTPIHDRHGAVTGGVIVFHDVTAARAQARRLSHLAHHDFLTDLPNRVLLSDRLNAAIAAAQRHRKPLAVLFLDVDRFKHINDTLGHTVGDHLLQSIAKRLLTCVRRSDTVSRHGGDEFVVLLSEVAHAQDAAVCAEKIVAAMDTPYRIDQHDLHVTLSVGIGLYPDDGTNADTLLRNADIDLFQAKAYGHNNHRPSVRAL